MVYVNMKIQHRCGVPVVIKFLAADIQSADEYIDEICNDDDTAEIMDLFIDGNYGTVVVLPEDYEY